MRPAGHLPIAQVKPCYLKQAQSPHVFSHYPTVLSPVTSDRTGIALIAYNPYQYHLSITHLFSNVLKLNYAYAKVS